MPFSRAWQLRGISFVFVLPLFLHASSLLSIIFLSRARVLSLSFLLTYLVERSYFLHARIRLEVFKFEFTNNESRAFLSLVAHLALSSSSSLLSLSLSLSLFSARIRFSRPLAPTVFPPCGIRANDKRFRVHLSKKNADEAFLLQLISGEREGCVVSAPRRQQRLEYSAMRLGR